MEGPAADVPPASRLDPFALPLPLDARLWLQVAGTLGAGGFLLEEVIARFAVFGRSSSGWSLAGRELAGMVALGTCAVGIWWLLPAWIIWRRRLRPVPVEDLPELAGHLSRLVAEAGLEQPVTFVWDPLDPAVGGVAIGRPGRAVVSLTGGLVLAFGRDLPAFRATVLHELAHFRNRDVDRTYLAVAIWRAFLLTALAPFLALAFVTWSLPPDVPPAALGARVLGLTALAYLTRNAVLRSREVYADLRVSTWGAGPALRRLLGAPGPATRDGRPAWLATHPDPRRRVRLLDSTVELFDTGPTERFATGCILGMAYLDLTFILQLASPGVAGQTPMRSLAPVESLVAGILLAPLALRVLGSEVWREAAGDLARGRPARGSPGAGLALGLGLVVGPNLSFSGLQLLGLHLGSVGFLPLNLAYDVLVVGVAVLLVRWLRMVAAVLLRAGPVGLPSAVLLVGSIGPSVGLARVLSLSEFVGQVITDYHGDPTALMQGPALATLLGEAVLLLVDPVLLLALVSGWALPIGLAMRRRSPATSRWRRSLAPDGAPVVEPLPVEVGPRRAVVVAAAVGVGTVAAVPLVVPLVVRAFGVPSDLFLALVVLTAGVGIAFAALLAAAVAPGLRVAHGMLAAFAVSSADAGTLLLALTLLGHRAADPALWLGTFAVSVNGSALVAFPFALLGSRLARPRPAPERAASRKAWTPAPAALLAALWTPAWRWPDRRSPLRAVRDAGLVGAAGIGLASGLCWLPALVAAALAPAGMASLAILVGAPVVLQVVAATLAAGRGREPGIVRGLVAAATAGGMVVLGALPVVASEGPSLAHAFALAAATVGWVVRIGMVAALPAAWLSAFLARR